LEPDKASLDADISWSSIISGIRLYARRQPPDVTEDLNEWASLLGSLEALQTRNQ
jgi:hypothetical protein